jgi:steroid delta-isomerase-like uncharacterized protein
MRPRFGGTRGLKATAVGFAARGSFAPVGAARRQWTKPEEKEATTMAEAMRVPSGDDPLSEADRPRTPEEVARRSFEGVAARDPDTVVRYAHPDDVDDFVAIGQFRGKDAIRAFFQELFAAAPDFQFRVERIVADDRTAVTEWTATGTFTGGPFVGIRPTGRRVEIRGVDVMDVEDGLIRHNTIYYDGATFARQVGLLPPAGSVADRTLLRAFNATTRVRAALRRRRRQ